MILDKAQFDFTTVNFYAWSEADKAWAAGFIDGDGMIALYRRSDRSNEFFVKVAAMNTNIAPLEKLQLMFGGSICEMAKTTNTHNWAPSWQWSVTHRTAERVLHALSGYFVAKQEQASLALEARTLVGDRHRKRSPETIAALASIETRFRALNRKGKDVLSH